MATPDIETSAARRFDMGDQQRFAALSGDRNPMHLDPVVARRTMAGEPVVHGMHILLWALNIVSANDPEAPAPATLRADFTTFLPLGQLVSLAAVESTSKRRIVVSNGDETVMIAELRYGEASITNPIVFDGPAEAVPMSPIGVGPDNLDGIRGAIAFPADAATVSEAFPAAAAWLGSDRIAALLSCTAVVGMICPGYHSVFNRVDVSLHGDSAPERLDYAVTSVDHRFRRVLLSVTSARMSGTLYSSLRPPPTEQPGMAILAASVKPGEFKNSKALVIGGSRGLGELAAKLLATGGADVIITYALGQHDAEKVCAEITASGGKARAIPLDVLGDVADQLRSIRMSITSCYYFATPRISGKAGSLYDKSRFDHFCAMYVDGFDRVCDFFRHSDVARLGMYYPSTVFVDERPVGMSEYAMAKAAGEILCGEYNSRQAKLRILFTRLPKLDTDQTATILQSQGKSTVDCLLPIVRKVESISEIDDRSSVASNGA